MHSVIICIQMSTTASDDVKEANHCGTVTNHIWKEESLFSVLFNNTYLSNNLRMKFIIRPLIMRILHTCNWFNNYSCYKFLVLHILLYVRVDIHSVGSILHFIIASIWIQSYLLYNAYYVYHKDQYNKLDTSLGKMCIMCKIWKKRFHFHA